MKEKIGVIGVGNMGAAILEGLIRKEIAKPNQIWVYDKLTEKAAELARQIKVHLASSNTDVVNQSDVILLAVKPQDLTETASKLRAFFKKSQVVISILAGTPVAKIRKVIGEQPAIVRAMPNLGAKVGQSVTALSGSVPGALDLAVKIFSGCGKTAILSEEHFDLVTAVSGSGPAYFFLLTELLVKFAVENGLPQKTAELLAIQTAVGAGLLAQASDVSPEELRKRVTSKGGTTEAALAVLQSKNFSGTFRDALKAALERGRELSHDS